MSTQFICAGMVIAASLFSSAEARACEHCRPLVESAVYNPDFFANFLVLMVPLVILATLGLLAHHLDGILANLRSREGIHRRE